MRKNIIFILVVTFTFVNTIKSNDEYQPIVSTSLGKIRGAIMKTRNDRPFFAFRGIRYGKPMTGEKRFKASEPVDAWSNEIVYDATEDGPACPQPYNVNRSMISEDCLMLNVYTNYLTNNKDTVARKQPTIIFIHPGGFYGFYGRSDGLGPQYLLDKDVVVVTINYRLGSLGYMSTGTKECPGNAGFKDQVLALRWIQNHISRFGGDPDNVSIMGYSAGAMSATLHMVSPMSRGLFHKVIVMSAAGTGQWKVPNDQYDLAIRQANLFNMTEPEKLDRDELVRQMRSIDVNKYMDTQTQMFDLKNGNPLLLWYPVVENDFGQERFLVEDPTVSYKSSNYQKVPVMAGITQDEFLSIAYYLLTNNTSLRDINNNFDRVAPIYCLYDREGERSRNITHSLREFYFSNQSTEINLDNSFQPFGKMLSDGTIGFEVHRFVGLVAPENDVYYYKSVYQGNYSFFPLHKQYNSVVHHDDLQYLFWLQSTPMLNSTYPENEIVTKMVNMWTNFVATGDPNDRNQKVWEPVKNNLFNYLEIGENLTMKNYLFTERFNVWDKIFPID